MLVISWLSLTPTPPEIPGDFFGWDKLQHAGAYGIFALLASWAFGTFSLDWKRSWRLAVLAAVTFGGMLEIAQGVLTTWRSAEWGDLLADLLGAVSSYGLIMALNRTQSTIKRS